MLFSSALCKIFTNTASMTLLFPVKNYLEGKGEKEEEKKRHQIHEPKWRTAARPPQQTRSAFLPLMVEGSTAETWLCSQGKIIMLHIAPFQLCREHQDRHGFITILGWRKGGRKTTWLNVQVGLICCN